MLLCQPTTSFHACLHVCLHAGMHHTSNMWRSASSKLKVDSNHMKEKKCLYSPEIKIRACTKPPCPTIIDECMLHLNFSMAFKSMDTCMRDCRKLTAITFKPSCQSHHIFASIPCLKSLVRFKTLQPRWWIYILVSKHFLIAKVCVSSKCMQNNLHLICDPDQYFLREPLWVVATSYSLQMFSCIMLLELAIWVPIVFLMVSSTKDQCLDFQPWTSSSFA